MSDPTATGRDRNGLDDAFAAAEAHKSNLLLEGQMLEAQARMDEAAQRFAQAAEQEEWLAEKCAAQGLAEKTALHRFSAAGCWTRAGNLFRAILLCDDLLRSAQLSEPLRQRVQEYAHCLRGRRAQWLAGLAAPFTPAGV